MKRQKGEQEKRVEGEVLGSEYGHTTWNTQKIIVNEYMSVTAIFL